MDFEIASKKLKAEPCYGKINFSFGKALKKKGPFLGHGLAWFWRFSPIFLRTYQLYVTLLNGPPWDFLKFLTTTYLNAETFCFRPPLLSSATCTLLEQRAYRIGVLRSRETFPYV